ncbi:MAG: hypothetical protein IPI46_06155 [Bacteroidetes bacterium]|nr:hypothetical protein [Bacteroidota bacterium]
MPLTTYKEVSAYGRMIAHVTQSKIMPPWKDDPQFASIKHNNKLNEHEIALIKQWVDSGMAKGQLIKNKGLTPPEKNPTITKPDLVYAMSQPYHQIGDYNHRNMVFVIPTKLSEDVFADEIEFVPGNKKIVKSCTISIDTGDSSTLFDSYDLNYGYRSFSALSFIPHQYAWYQWNADSKTIFKSDTYVKKIPAGSKLLFHITYVASTSIQKDSSYVKIHLSQNMSGKKEINSQVLFNQANITNGPFIIKVDEQKKFYAKVKLDHAIEIQSIMPMGQYACSSWEFYAIDSISRNRINILSIPKWDANWKKKYELQKTLQLSKGSEIFAIATYDNSDENINLIILPPQKIKYGEGSRDELFLVVYDFVNYE